MQALRDDSLTRRIISWEVSDNSPQVRRLSDARSQALGLWIEKVRGTMPPPKSADHVMLNGMLLAASAMDGETVSDVVLLAPGKPVPAGSTVG